MSVLISLDDWRKKQAKLSKQTSVSNPTLALEELGLTPTEIDDQMAHSMAIYLVLDRAHRRSFSVKSRFAREGAFYVAMAASEAWITTAADDHPSNEQWANHWVITESGIRMRRQLDEILRAVTKPEDTPN